MKKGLISGVILVAVGAFLIYYAIDHGPYASLGDKVSNFIQQGSEPMTEAWYYTTLTAGSIIALLGLRNLIKS